MFTHAITRLPGEDAAQGITTSHLGPPDYQLLLAQHAAYVAALRSLGLEVTVLDPLPGFPDAYFVEDAAVFTPGLAVLTRPGAPARRGEADAIEPALVGRRPLARIEAPGTLDGGDVLMVGNHFFIGLSERTNRPGAEQLGALLSQHGYTWQAVPVGAGLHLKSSVNYAGKNASGKDTLLITPGLAADPAFAGYEHVLVAPGEEYAANVLWVNGTLIVPAGYPVTGQKLAALGLPLFELEVSEVGKMDGGLTCMSLRY